jgi:hypothetical protein
VFDSIEKGLLDKVGAGIFVGIATVSVGMMLTWATKAQLGKE